MIKNVKNSPLSSFSLLSSLLSPLFYLSLQQEYKKNGKLRYPTITVTDTENTSGSRSSLSRTPVALLSLGWYHVGRRTPQGIHPMG
jgi:hypothetical protein